MGKRSKLEYQATPAGKPYSHMILRVAFICASCGSKAWRVHGTERELCMTCATARLHQQRRDDYNAQPWWRRMFLRKPC